VGTVSVKTISETPRNSEISLIFGIRTTVFAGILDILILGMLILGMLILGTLILEIPKTQGIHPLEKLTPGITTRTTLSTSVRRQPNLLQVSKPDLLATVKRARDKFPKAAIDLHTVPGVCPQVWPLFLSRTLVRIVFLSRKSLI
jgi:hypothetical protein